MLRYLLTEETETIVIYKYYPENKSAFGIVSYNKSTNKAHIIALAKNDKHQRYALKLQSIIKTFASISTYQKEGIITWY